MTELTVLHYNDVYNVDSTTSKEPIGGAARFVTALKTFDSLKPLILFSGDIFSPSMLSTFTKGEQMVPVLNATNTACAVFGNHDFDHGLDVLTGLIKNTTFPWLMSNVIDNETGKPLGNGLVKHVINHEGFKVGLIGLVEKEWLETLATIDPKSVTFIDYVEAGNRLTAELKDTENCDIVIALTHMRTPNDKILAKNCSRIDLVLGGHDHVYEIIDVNGIKIIKSGTDFRQFSKLTIKKKRLPNDKIDLSVETVNVTSEYSEDQTLKVQLEKYTSVIAEKMKEELGTFSVELDGRFSMIRTEETNLGDWVCDVVLAATGADIVMINSGTFRSDQIHPPGPFLMKDLVNIIPMRDPLILLEISGKCLKAALENSVFAYPKLEGRFPQVAGILFAFDPKKDPGHRIDERLIFVGDELFNDKHSYKICIKSYMHGGCDGYSMFKDTNVLLDDDSCPELGLAIQNHFKAINMKHEHSKTKHRQSLVTISRRSSMCQAFQECEELDGPCPIRKISHCKSVDHADTNNHIEHNGSTVSVKERSPRPQLARRPSVQEYEEITCQLAPKTQQRIIRIKNVEHFNELLVQAISFKNLSLNESILEIEEASE